MLLFPTLGSSSSSLQAVKERLSIATNKAIAMYFKLFKCLIFVYVLSY